MKKLLGYHYLPAAQQTPFDFRGYAVWNRAERTSFGTIRYVRPPAGTQFYYG